MAWTLVGSDAVGFADGGSPGHIYTIPSGAPSVGDLDVLAINSNGTVTTPSGWTLPTNGSKVNNQGAYFFYRKAVGGEGSTVTIVTSVSTSTALGWSRWQGANAFDLAANATVTTSAGMTTPALTTSALAATNELVVAFGALHNVSSAVSAPSWSTGYTALTGISQVGSTSAAQFVGYKTGAGTAAESPNVTWSGGSVFNRTIIVLTFTPASGSIVTASASASGALAATGAATDLIPVAAGPSAALSAAGAALVSVRPSATASATLTASAAGRLLVPLAAAASASLNATASLEDNIVHRPFTGTVTRPNTGIVRRP